VLSLDVPECLVNPGESTVQHATAVVEASTIHCLPVVFDPTWVLSDEILLEFRDSTEHCVGFPFEIGLTPADDPEVGFDPEKYPPWLNTERLESGYLHVSSPRN
jgi:hypothetical protein